MRSVHTKRWSKTAAALWDRRTHSDLSCSTAVVLLVAWRIRQEA